jgi:hypothetical protein
MSTAVQVNVTTYSTTHVATNLVRSLKQLVTACGLSASKLLGEWQTLENGVATWLASRHLQTLTLEIYGVSTGVLVARFDFSIDYTYHPNGNGDLWIDPDTVDYAVRKSGAIPANCSYDVFARTAAGRPDVAGWSNGTMRSTAHLQHRSVGAAVGGGEIGASLSYWK